MSLLGRELDPVLVLAGDGNVEGLKAIDEADLLKKLSKRDEDHRTALHRACSAGHREVVEFLLSKGADTNLEDEEGWAPLHTCASKGDLALLEAILSAKADVDQVTSAGVSALHFACSKGHADVIEALLSAGAKRNVRDKRGGTPLLRAAGCGRDKVLRMLLDAKADVKAKDKAGENALHVAINGQHVAACAVLMSVDEAQELMAQENVDGHTPARLLMETHPMEVRDTLKSVWREQQGGG